MTPSQLSDAVLRSVRGALADGELASPDGWAARDVALRPVPRGAAGDWATGIAFRLAGPAGRPAPEVARVLGGRLRREPGVGAVAVSGGGFLNITLAEGADVALLREILATPPPPALPEDPARDVARWREAAGGGDPAALLVQREENPLFLVRYAHARSRALQRAAVALRLRPEPGQGGYAYPYAGERAALGLLGEYGRRAARPAWLRRLADALLGAEAARSTLPRGDEKPGAAHGARLALAQAVGLVLAGGLGQLGVSAPEHV